MTIARGIYEDQSPPHRPPFLGGLARLPLPTLSGQERQVMALLGALEAIRSGTTLVLEDDSGLDGYAAALADTGLRLLLCERAWDRAGAAIGLPGPFAVDDAQAELGLTRIADLRRGGTGPVMGASPPASPPGRPISARPGSSGGSAISRSGRGRWRRST